MNHLIRFINKKYKVLDIPFTQFDLAFIEVFDFYIRIELRLMSNIILGVVRHVRKMIKLAIAKGILFRDPCANYVADNPLKQRRHLTMEEFQ